MHLYCEFSLSEQGDINTAQWSQHVRSISGNLTKDKAASWSTDPCVIPCGIRVCGILNKLKEVESHV